MKMKIKPMAWALLFAGLLVSTMVATAFQKEESRALQADVILIDTMQAFGRLERPAVPFPHDRHTEALAKQDRDCSTCHESRAEELSDKFQRLADSDADSMLDVYHKGCITCHEQSAAAGLQSGPLTCGACHQLNPSQVAGQQQVDFDASLHHRHIQAEEGKCDSCHHGYDAAGKQIRYTRGEEESCRTCHGEQLLDKAAPFRAAAHRQCISCHREQKTVDAVQNSMLAAVKCAGCHDPAQLSTITKLDPIPRLERNQPDLTFVKSVQAPATPTMDFVVFDHLKHEGRIESCSSCHHQSLKSCESCHSRTGSREGNWVTLAQAMHETRSDHSCVGCHAQKTVARDCAGCHTLVKLKPHVSEGDDCRTCHTVPAARLEKALTQDGKSAAQRFRPGTPAPTAVDLQTLPETVMIDALSDQYEGVSLPHREIVASLLAGIKDSGLAATFHQGENRICQSCHHNSPGVTDPPPGCISCHGPQERARNNGISEMKAAYHQQCFDCHKAMDISRPDSTDCVACHAEKKRTALLQSGK